MSVRFYNIEWDTDGEPTDLPTEVVREVEDGIDVGLEGADILSNEFGFCHYGFDYEIL